MGKAIGSFFSKIGEKIGEAASGVKSFFSGLVDRMRGGGEAQAAPGTGGGVPQLNRGQADKALAEAMRGRDAEAVEAALRGSVGLVRERTDGEGYDNGGLPSFMGEKLRHVSDADHAFMVQVAEDMLDGIEVGSDPKLEHLLYKAASSLPPSDRGLIEIERQVHKAVGDGDLGSFLRGNMDHSNFVTGLLKTTMDPKEISGDVLSSTTSRHKTEIEDVVSDHKSRLEELKSSKEWTDFHALPVPEKGTEAHDEWARKDIELQDRAYVIETGPYKHTGATEETAPLMIDLAKEMMTEIFGTTHGSLQSIMSDEVREYLSGASDKILESDLSAPQMKSALMKVYSDALMLRGVNPELTVGGSQISGMSSEGKDLVRSAVNVVLSVVNDADGAGKLSEPLLELYAPLKEEFRGEMEAMFVRLGMPSDGTIANAVAIRTI